MTSKVGQVLISNKMFLPLNSIVKNINPPAMACSILQLATCLYEWDYQYHLCNKNTNNYTDVLPGLKNFCIQWGN